MRTVRNELFFPVKICKKEKYGMINKLMKLYYIFDDVYLP